MAREADITALQKLLLSGRRYKLHKKQVIQTTEDRRVFNLISSGFVKRYLITNEGNLGVQVVYGPGDAFPITLALRVLLNFDVSKSPEVYYYEAVCPTEIYTIDAESLKSAVEADPLLYKELFAICGDRLHSSLNGLENIMLANAYKRVAHMLRYFADRFGEKTPSGIKIAIPLTHQDMADILSLSRETVTTCMSQLRDKKLITTSKHITVLNQEKLSAEAFS